MQRSNNGTTTSSACASCKHQRKKCTEKCVLAPYFPAEKSREFQAVHRVFGVSNVTKMVRSLNEEDRRRAVESLVWEAVCRQNDPVWGPLAEYRRVYEELRLYKTQYHELPTSVVIGWNNNNNSNNNNENSNNNNNSLNNYIHSNGNSVVTAFNNYHPINHSEKLRGENENKGPTVTLPRHQHPISGFNQQYFIAAGQYNPADSKSIESSLWDGVS